MIEALAYRKSAYERERLRVFCELRVKTPGTMPPNRIGPAPCRFQLSIRRMSGHHVHWPLKENPIPTPQLCQFRGTTTKILSLRCFSVLLRPKTPEDQLALLTNWWRVFSARAASKQFRRVG